MTWQYTKRDGNGGLEFRLEIQGWPYQFVSHPQMEVTLADTRERVALLVGHDIDWSEQCDVPNASLEGSAPTFTIVDPRGEYDVPSILARVPVVLAKMTDTLKFDEGLVGIEQVGGAWNPRDAGPEYVHIGNEVVKALTVLTTDDGPGNSSIILRGEWGTAPHAHFAINHQAVNASSPVITDVPYTMEGRWAKLFVYGSGDDPQGDGAQIWRGYVQTDARYEGDATWSIPCEPIHARLSDKMFANAGEELGIRGVQTYVNLSLRAQQGNSSPLSCNITFSGFWETQSGFVSELSTAMNVARTGGSAPALWGGTGVIFSYENIGSGTLSDYGFSLIEAYEEDAQTTYVGGALGGRHGEVSGRYGIRVTQGASYELVVSSGPGFVRAVEPGFRPGQGSTPVTSYWYSESGSYVAEHKNNVTQGVGAGTYRLVPDPLTETGEWDALSGIGFSIPGSGRVPRRQGASRSGNLNGVRLYLSTVPTATNDATCFAIRYKTLTSLSGEADLNVAIDPDNGYMSTLGNEIDFATPIAWAEDTLSVDTIQSEPFSAGVVYAFHQTGNSKEPASMTPDSFFSELKEQSQHVSSDVIPPLYNGDIDGFTTGVYTEPWKDRTYVFSEPLEFWKVASPILQMHKRIPYYDSSGNMSVRPANAFSQPADHVIEEEDIVGLPSFERSGILGAISKIIIDQNADPFTGDFYGPHTEIRSMRVLDAIGAKNDIEIEWTPFAGGKTARDNELQLSKNYVPNGSDLSEHFSQYLEQFSLGTFTIGIQLPIHHIDVVVGDIIDFSSGDIPNPKLGNYGAYNIAGLVIARSVSFPKGTPSVNIQFVTNFTPAS